MYQLTLIALYGKKPMPLQRFIADWQARLSVSLGASFRPYDEQQVHATVIGLEAVAGTTNVNANFMRLRGRTVQMDLNGFLESLHRSASFPMHIRVGGYADRDYPFTSRALRPYQRSFSIQGDKIVVMGWPVAGSALDSFPPTLDVIRRSGQEFGILHSYHASEADVDNDFFFRLGTFDPAAVSIEQLRQIEVESRRALSEAAPLVVPITIADLRLAAYGDNRLPPATTRTCAVADVNVVGAFLESLNR